ncbi:RNA polymerase sigma factor [bacterium]|nr:RNA polymerase sigma factor [bacterium]
MDPYLSPQDRLRFDAEIMPHLDVLYRMACSVCAGGDHAKDVAQEAFIKALRGFGNFTPGSNGRSWLARIVHNTCRDHWRQLRARPEDQWDADADWAVENTLADPDWEPEIIRNAFSADLDRALQQLPPLWRAGLLLVDVEGWPYEEAAASLEIPLGTLRSGLHRARRRLYRLLSEPQDETQLRREGA